MESYKGIHLKISKRELQEKSWLKNIYSSFRQCKKLRNKRIKFDSHKYINSWDPFKAQMGTDMC